MPDPENVYDQQWNNLETEIPVSDPRFAIDGEEWLPKTDWSRDGIIASDDH